MNDKMPLTEEFDSSTTRHSAEIDEMLIKAGRGVPLIGPYVEIIDSLRSALAEAESRIAAFEYSEAETSVHLDSVLVAADEAGWRRRETQIISRIKARIRNCDAAIIPGDFENINDQERARINELELLSYEIAITPYTPPAPDREDNLGDSK